MKHRVNCFCWNLDFLDCFNIHSMRKCLFRLFFSNVLKHYHVPSYKKIVLTMLKIMFQAHIMIKLVNTFYWPYGNWNIDIIIYHSWFFIHLFSALQFFIYNSKILNHKENMEDWRIIWSFRKLGNTHRWWQYGGK